jgi:hypothetical protein
MTLGQSGILAICEGGAVALLETSRKGNRRLERACHVKASGIMKGSARLVAA